MQKYYGIFFFKEKVGRERFYPVLVEAENTMEATEKSYEFKKEKIKERDKEWYNCTFLGLLTEEEFNNEYTNQ